ncbi:DUF4294 domain-containing protein [Croceimicrobium hydrocarbonivorans]|uniref:DUF4294 domain-containing protein n=1 Tax=Croceimicrobium hydrocarbonivorans TaxID=2761580 RepID=A0A7H0VEN9_9FLAO|nr:DUF4294 domain-containing protein [Croceimicrobium hydrocarbonivorans]QNR24187.1 DUF4294 domain-containing protein [Croceimicrobium hydrocarbonivorans]
MIKHLQVIFIISLLQIGGLWAQPIKTGSSLKDSIVQYAAMNRTDIMDAIIVDGDTIPIMVLDEVLLVDKPSFDSKEARKRYFILKRKVMKVYPYAVIAGNKMDSLKLTLEGKNRWQRKRLIKEFQEYLRQDFEEEIVKLTHSEGQILSKLVSRETGMSTYDLISEYRSGWNAFWWNTVAYFNHMDLKTPYQPEEVEEDKLIENILQRAFIQGQLKERVPITSLNAD